MPPSPPVAKARAANGQNPTLGSLLRGVRDSEGWTLKEMSANCGIPVSTLSKIEHDRLTLTYDKLQQVAARLGMRLSDLLADNAGEPANQPVTARRSIGSIDNAVRVETPNYQYNYLCTELRQKRMIPAITRIRAHSLVEFGDLFRHSGEEFLYVLNGRIVVHTQFYDPVTLGAGECIYIDSSMSHAYLVAEGCDEAEVLAVMSSEEEVGMEALLAMHSEDDVALADGRTNGKARKIGGTPAPRRAASGRRAR